MVIAFKRSIASFQSNESLDQDNTILMDEGEELGMGRVERSIICPLTRQTMVEPVKNSSCGHTYSKEGIYIYIYIQST